ncbi:MAG TPA: hypothetical protein V6C97_32855 [Oculatellaceae cyanobacterium]
MCVCLHPVCLSVCVYVCVCAYHLMLGVCAYVCVCVCSWLHPSSAVARSAAAPIHHRVSSSHNRY